MPDPAQPFGGTSLPRRLARQFVGLTVTGVRYIIQRVPMYRRDRQMADAEPPDLERDLPGDPATLQRASSGVGGLFHRRYSIVVTDEKFTPAELIAYIADEPNRVTPTELASFETFDGEPARQLQVGDELIVRLPGPWDGPVRVIERTETTFRFVTLTGHMEAGEIEFTAGYDDRGFLRFQIDSWARSGDRLFYWIYERFPVGRELQLHMWSQFCQRVADVAGGVRMSNVSSTTRQIG